MAKRLLVALTTAPAALLIGCHSDSPTLPTDPPTTVTQVATGGFTSPTDAVSSPDGSMFYFGAFLTDEDKTPAVMAAASDAGSAAAPIAMGDPLNLPIGLVMSCDGATVYVADLGGDGDGAVLSASSSGGAVTDLGATGLMRPGGIAMGPDCNTLFVTGYMADGTPGVFTMSTAGGGATALFAGAPLVSPTGLHVDNQGVAWVMDHLAVGDDGEGVLFAIDSSGATEVASDLRMGMPGGVSLTAGGGTAVMPTVDHDGHAQLTSVNIDSGERVDLAVPAMIDPAGLRTAREAGVFAVVDSEGGAIYRAE
jgi:DNA-binding beta-propeller fold protein YncE